MPQKNGMDLKGCTQYSELVMTRLKHMMSAMASQDGIIPALPGRPFIHFP
jgi:hypothetical protein